jgi:hypothetical protein
MKWKVVLLAMLTACSTKPPQPTASPETPTPKVLNAWLEWTPGSKLQARAIAATSECPQMQTDQGRVPMKARAEVSNQFPDLVCEAMVPAGTKTLQIETIFLPIPSKKMSRIVILGDTGCRLKDGKDGKPGSYQACNDPKKWPLKAVSEAAAHLQPDLVIHVGDYHYREGTCPQGNAGCKGVATGYGWNAWNEDFFRPAQSLLEAAPWIFVRGNHELCSRAGEGWFHMLDPYPYQACVDQTPAYTVEFGSHQLDIVDNAEEKNLVPSLKTLKTTQKYRWLLVHRPFVTANKDGEAPSGNSIPKSLRAPGQISLVLVGHVHILSINQFADQRPAELIIGNGSTDLDHNVDFLVKKTGDEFFMMKNFGFVSMDRISDSRWKLNVHDVEGKVLKTCQIRESHENKTAIQCE